MKSKLLWKQYCTILIGCWCCCLHIARAQPTITTTVDRNKILIGEPIRLKVEAKLAGQDYFVRWFNLPDTMQHFEVIDKGKVDSIYAHQKLTALVQTFTLTSFDSGKWLIPAFNANFSPVNGDSALTLYTDSVPVRIAYLADSTNEIRDIKPIRDAAYEFPIWYWIAGGAVLLLLLAAIVWTWLQAKKKKPTLSQTALSAYQMAMQALAELEQLPLTEAAKVKQYHSQLALVLKQYLSYKRQIDYNSFTTDELLHELRKEALDHQQTTALAAALRCSNAVKFAKFIPSGEDNQSALHVIRRTIDCIEQSTSTNTQS